ncbi:MAG TPA: DUF5302 domain-containing protein [Streptosporangiaceae bacterium]|nr:DUF5302 domain-containing protein [Streptosporangiaceae bacterium]
MADKAAGPQRSGDKTGPGKKPVSPDRASATDEAGSGDGAGQRDKAAARDDAQVKFREALERKRAMEADNVSGRGGKGTGKIHGAHGPAGSRRPFRRKSG